MTLRINLLPDARQAKLHNQRMRQVATTAAVAICGVSVGVVVLLFGITAAQASQLKDRQTKIDSAKADIKNFPDVDNILTTQATLKTLPSLYAQRTLESNFLAVVSAVSPTSFGFSQIDLDAANGLKASGTARDYLTVVKLVKAMEAKNLPDGSLAFANVTLGSVGQESTGKVNFTITATMLTGVTSVQHN